MAYDYLRDQGIDPDERTIELTPIESAPLCNECEDRCALINELYEGDTVTQVFACDEHPTTEIKIAYRILVGDGDVYFNRITER